jgi:hypothetical protein
MRQAKKTGLETRPRNLRQKRQKGHLMFQMIVVSVKYERKFQKRV